MTEVVHDAPQEFWSPPSVVGPPPQAAALPPAACAGMADACSDCGSEFMIGARFCHTCGLRRGVLNASPGAVKTEAEVIAGLWWAKDVAWVKTRFSWAIDTWHEISFPKWLHYLHFHEIKRWVGLSTAALIAFIVGLGCVAGAIGVSLFYKASNLAEFQAIQMWRIEWLLAATASFVAGILLKRSDNNQ
jgi:hypothetical protein